MTDTTLNSKVRVLNTLTTQATIELRLGADQERDLTSQRTSRPRVVELVRLRSQACINSITK